MASHLVSDQVFRPYPSLFPSRPTDTAINTLVKHGVCDPTEEAVAVPKIHGANFQASFNVRRVRFWSRKFSPFVPLQSTLGLLCGRRGAYLGPTEDFNGCRATIKEIGLEESMARLFSMLATDQSRVGLKSVTVFFEIYGGAYPHPEVAAPKPKHKCVQSGVWYAPR